MEGKNHFQAYAYSWFVFMFCSLEEKCSKGGGILIIEYERYMFYNVKYIFFQKFLELVRKSYGPGGCWGEVAYMVSQWYWFTDIIILHESWHRATKVLRGNEQYE